MEIDWILDRLKQGGVVAIPTETVYGLAADASNPAAVKAIFTTKGRPQTNPLIVHVASVQAARTLVTFTPEAEALAQAFWPGPLTLVAPRRPDAPVAEAVSAGLETLAVRVPAHPLMQQVLQALGRPLAAPSANRSGRPSPTTADHVAQDFGPPLSILDGGPCDKGLESTVVQVLPDHPVQILRYGSLSPQDIAAVVPVAEGLGPGEASPGRLLRHYAPQTPLVLNITVPEPTDAYLSFGPTDHTGPCFPLSARGDMTEAAQRLFAQLRAADTSGAPRIAVAPVPDRGVGLAINDRLRRAAGAVG